MISRRLSVNRMSLVTAAAVALPKSVYSSWYQNSEEYVNIEISLWSNKLHHNKDYFLKLSTFLIAV